MSTPSHIHPDRFRLTPAEAEQARDVAWDRYVYRGHADTRVGWSKYLRDLKEIDALEARP